MLEVRRQETDIFFSRKFPKLSTLMVLCHETPPLTFFRKIAHLLKAFSNTSSISQKYSYQKVELLTPRSEKVSLKYTSYV